MRHLTVLAILLVAGSWPGGTRVFAQNHFDGVYELVRLDTPDGPQATQNGMLIVSNGYLCHLRVNKEREKLSRDDTRQQRMMKAAEAYRAATATCGSFTLEGERVTAHWTVALDPGDQGNTSEFIFKEVGETLSIAPARSPDFRFVYRRLK